MTPEFKGRFIETFMSPSTIDGKLYGLPVAASARAMYYNKDLLAKAGVREPPATWDALIEAAEKVKALGGDVYRFALQGKEIETDAYWYYRCGRMAATSSRTARRLASEAISRGTSTRR